MKSVIKLCVVALVAVVMLGSSVTNSRAQKSNALSVDFINLFVSHYFTLQYETSLGDDNALALRAYFAPSSSYTADYSAPGIGAAYRFYLGDRAIKGFSVGPAVDAFFFNNSKLNRSTTILSIGVDGAYKLIAGSFAVEPQLSLRFGAIGDNISNYSGAYVYASVYLGYAW